MVLVLLLSACQSSLQLATRFVMQETDINVLLLPPPEIYVAYYPQNPERMDDSLLYAGEHLGGRLVPVLDDSVFVNRFMQSVVYHLGLLHVKVYLPEDAETFFEMEGRGHIFSLAQMEVLEYPDTEIFFAYHAGERHVREVEYTVLEQNLWFEYSQLHDPDHPMEVLFSRHTMADHMEGKFVSDPSLGLIRFEEDAFLLSPDDLMDMAYNSGRQHAHQIFDHILNKHIRREADYQVATYYHYDMENHVIMAREYPPFILIKSTPDESN